MTNRNSKTEIGQLKTNTQIEVVERRSILLYIQYSCSEQPPGGTGGALGTLLCRLQDWWRDITFMDVEVIEGRYQIFPTRQGQCVIRRSTVRLPFIEIIDSISPLQRRTSTIIMFDVNVSTDVNDYKNQWGNVPSFLRHLSPSSINTTKNGSRS